MKLIATLPPPHREQMIKVAEHPEVDGVRFNVGVRVPYSPKETLRRIMDCLKEKPLWIDLKCRQLRIAKWAVPTYGDIELSHKINVDLPATIIFRGGDESRIMAVDGKVIYVDPPPKFAIGAGQAINIHGHNFQVEGFLTDEDQEYIEAAKELGIHRYMLSFVEQEQDIKDLLALDPEAEIVIKIESMKGLQFSQVVEVGERLRLMVARDDLLINIGESVKIFDAMKTMIKRDPQAIVASRILTSLEDGENISMGDLSDLYLIHVWGYKTIMLSDGLCFKKEAFSRAMQEYCQFKNYIQGGD